MAMAANTGWMVKISASFPVRGVSNPPIPTASPIMRLEAMDFPWGANLWARVKANLSIKSGSRGIIKAL